MFPKSCDTFIVLPPFTKNGSVIFGKNSDRPQNEVQEVVLIQGGTRASKLKCTYITIEESPNPINTVILSKPAWMWGAEMGANNKNVVIGNEAVWTNNNEGDGDARQHRLLGMDLVRLGLERGNSAENALNIITTLLEKYGQGGPCSERDDSLFYHNSFLIADTKEAWVLETSGKLWAAERVDGFRNISNGLTIGAKIDKHSDNLQGKAKAMGLWDGQGDFNFTSCFSSGADEERQVAGEKLLRQKTENSSFFVHDMFDILRDRESRICRSCEDTFPTQGSQVSSLLENNISVHWFTATPDASISHFKPFVFTTNPQISPLTESPKNEPKLEHGLYKSHAKHISEGGMFIQGLRELELGLLGEIEEFIERYKQHGQISLSGLNELMKCCVDTEIGLYTNSITLSSRKGVRNPCLQ
ncbi:hypothetical protein ACJJTC_000621 [Scirpophaga incertulas]